MSNEAEDVALCKRLLRGERRTLARLITWAESSLPADAHRLKSVLLAARAAFAGKPPCLRLGVSGSPGAGKSSLIERLGVMLVERGHRLAVLALDPSSQTSGGSLLGDQTRMPFLSAREQAFIRPTPARDAWGGVAHSTDLSIALCELAGFDPVIVETVGVGQNEIEVANLVDCLLLVLTPDSGDELQALKRGITEAADVVVVNKSDLSPERAEATRQRYEQALGLLRPEPPRVLTASSLVGTGIDALWDEITARHRSLTDKGELGERRRQRRRVEFRRGLERLFRDGLREPARARRLSAVEAALDRGELSVAEAVEAVRAELGL